MKKIARQIQLLIFLITFSLTGTAPTTTRIYHGKQKTRSQEERNTYLQIQAKLNFVQTHFQEKLRDTDDIFLIETPATVHVIRIGQLCAWGTRALWLAYIANRYQIYFTRINT